MRSVLRDPQKASPKNARPPNAPIPRDSIHIATSSIDGHVCVSSLFDQKDVTLRNYARPVRSVALSPNFKNDRTYLSGGLAGQLILTTGGRSGMSANANTNNAAAAASGWLGSVGLSQNTGKDTVLHSGEGPISSISWSLTGKYVAWVNEQGIKIMRSNLHLGSNEADLAWHRVGHIDRPTRRVWEDMASVWKARIQWVDENNLECSRESIRPLNPRKERSNSVSSSSTVKTTPKSPPRRDVPEKLLVGWGDIVWSIHVHPILVGSGSQGRIKSLRKPDIVNRYSSSRLQTL